MARRTIGQVVCALVILLVGTDCPAQVTALPKVPETVDCTAWKEACKECVTNNVEAIGVMLHIMQARGIDDDTRDSLQGKEPAWKLAPKADKVLEYWTPAAIDAIFGRDGKVNHIWKQAKIRFSLLNVETCEYQSERLRLDGRPRESMFTPESRMPWAAQLFRSINRLFTSAHPHVIHVLIWWSIMEDDVDGISVQGYARSAAHGGPAVWVDAYQCLRIPDEPSAEDATNYGGCGRLLAHEIGHTLGLQHVDDVTNLMNMWYSSSTVTQQQAEQARREARQQFLLK
jgi:hypothetical protein